MPVGLHAYFAGDDGRVVQSAYALPARSRYTISLGDAVGSGAFGAVFQSRTLGADVFVSRSVYWGPNLEGSTGAEATKTLATRWYFAEGSRGGELFNNYFLIFNPLQQATTVTFRFAKADGVNVTRSYTVPPQRRLTLSASDIAELAARRLQHDHRGGHRRRRRAGDVLEAALQSRPDWIGGTATLGSTALSRLWMFAEGPRLPASTPSTCC